jgi:hypothetical protein
MEAITRDVTGLVDSDRQSLEHLLGTSLNSAQQVTILAFTPGQIPSDDVRTYAKGRIEHLLDKAAQYRATHGHSDEEVDSAIDEAMDDVRRRSPS